MNVSLTPELEEFVNARVESGRCHSASEVVREALRLLEERDQEHQTQQLTEFNRELSRRLDMLDAGHYLDPEQVRARFQAKYDARKKSGA